MPVSKVHLAKSLQVRGRVAEAEAMYREVLRDEPLTADALEGLGVLVFQQGRSAEAAELFARGVAIRPQSARCHANLGEALRCLDRTDLALTHLRRATELDPKLPHAWNSLALLAYSQGRFADSEASCRLAIELEPGLTAAYINLGNALSALGRPDAAAEALRTALRNEPQNPLALMNLAWALCEANDSTLLNEAEALCRRAVALAPEIATGHKILGNILRLAGATKRREPASRKRLEATHNTPGLFRYVPLIPPRTKRATPRAWLSCSKAGSKKPRRVSSRRFELKPSHAGAWNGLARIHAERGDFEKCCTACREAIALDPRHAEAYWRLATAQKGEVTGAELHAMQALCDDASLSNDDRAFAGFAVAAVMERRGRFDQAAALLVAANAFHSAAKAARGLSCDPAVNTRLIERTRRAFTADFLARRKGWGSRP